MSNDMDKDITIKAANPDWEADQLRHEMRMHRLTAVDFAIRTEQISTIGSGDTSEAIRKRVIDNADEYVMYIMDGSVKD